MMPMSLNSAIALTNYDKSASCCHTSRDRMCAKSSSVVGPLPYAFESAEGSPCEIQSDAIEKKRKNSCSSDNTENVVVERSMDARLEGLIESGSGTMQGSNSRQPCRCLSPASSEVISSGQSACIVKLSARKVMRPLRCLWGR